VDGLLSFDSITSQANVAVQNESQIFCLPDGWSMNAECVENRFRAFDRIILAIPLIQFHRRLHHLRAYVLQISNLGLSRLHQIVRHAQD
jgi:hypothetical protein